MLFQSQAAEAVTDVGRHQARGNHHPKMLGTLSAQRAGFVAGVSVFITAAPAHRRSNVPVTIEDKKVAGCAFSSPCRACAAGRCVWLLGTLCLSLRPSLWCPLLGMGSRWLRWKLMVHRSVCWVAESIRYGVLTEPIVFSVFISGFQNGVACGQASAIWA